MKIYVETERLILREAVPDDVDGFFTLDSDPEVHKYLGNKPVKVKKQCEDVIQFIRQQYIDNGIGRWAIVEKNTNNFVGWTGLKYVKDEVNNHTNYCDLGYRLIRKYWGKGYAKESALASLEYGFSELKLNEIYAAAHTENIASNKILYGLGFQFIETFPYDESIHNWYKIERKR